MSFVDCITYNKGLFIVCTVLYVLVMVAVGVINKTSESKPYAPLSLVYVVSFLVLINLVAGSDSYSASCRAIPYLPWAVVAMPLLAYGYWIITHPSVDLDLEPDADFGGIFDI